MLRFSFFRFSSAMRFIVPPGDLAETSYNNNAKIHSSSVAAKALRVLNITPVSNAA